MNSPTTRTLQLSDMRSGYVAAAAFLLVTFYSPSYCLVSRVNARFTSTSICAQRRQPAALATTEHVIDGKSIREGSLVEYTSAKGSKRLAIVGKRVGAHLDVLNDAKKSFSVPISRVTYHINGTFAFGDLLRLNEILGDLKPIQVERLWEASFGQTNPAACTLKHVSKQIFGSTDAVRPCASMKLMASFGGVFFENVQGKGGGESAVTAAGIATGTVATSASSEKEMEVVFVPLSPTVVQQNLRGRAALKEFKQRFIKVMLRYSGYYVLR